MNPPRLILPLIICLNSLTLPATNYFVSTTGNNSNSGLTLNSTFLTLQHAANQVSAGDTVFVANGTYTAGFDHRGPSGTANQPIVFKTLGNAVTITGTGPIRSDGINIENADYIVIDGFRVIGMPLPGNGIRLATANHCVVRNNFCDGNGERGIFTAFTDDILIEHNTCINSVDEHGIYVSNSSDRPIVRYNECYGNNNIGIHFNGDLSAGGDGIISDAQVYGNILHDNNAAAGINMDGVDNPIIYNNLIYNNHSAQGIALFQQDAAIVTKGAKIFNNTIIVPTDGRWGILVKDGANVGTEIYNNIIINQHSFRGCIAIENQTGFTSDFNIVNDKMSANGDGSRVPLADWQALGFGQNSQVADNLTAIFTNPTLNDFHLVNNSQAIDAGTNIVNAIVQIDIDGNLRPSGMGYDVGVYEQPGCIQDLSITTNYTSGTLVETAANNITATNIINGNAAVTYIAGSCISLLPGFEVQTTGGATFHAFIQSCVPANFQAIEQAIDRKIVQINNDDNSLTEEAIQLNIQPNLVNSHAQIQFYLPISNSATVTLFDLHGRFVKVLQKGLFPKGWHQLDFQKGPLSSGIYYVTLQNKSDLQSQKIYILNSQ